MVNQLAESQFDHDNIQGQSSQPDSPLDTDLDESIGQIIGKYAEWYRLVYDVHNNIEEIEKANPSLISFTDAKKRVKSLLLKAQSAAQLGEHINFQLAALDKDFDPVEYSKARLSELNKLIEGDIQKEIRK